MPGVSVPVIGFVDVLAKTSTQSGPRHADHGRQDGPPGVGQRPERKELQARIYAAAVPRGGGPLPHPVDGLLGFYPRDDPQACRVQRLDPALSERDVLLTMDLLRR